jgi:hypothetical protein
MKTRRYAGMLLWTTAAILGLSTAQAGQMVVYQLGVDAVGANEISDVVTGWTTPGAFGSAIPLTNDTADFRSSWVDNATNWASVTKIDVGMYNANGTEVANFDFAGPDTVQGAGVTLSSFFLPGDLVSTNYTDIPNPFTGNFFSESGDSLRKWFVQNNYNGCQNDAGWMVVDIGGGEGCGWENSQQTLNSSGNGRVFLYALDDILTNWNNNGIGTPDDVGSADVFAVTVTSDLVSSTAPEPSTLLTLAGALGALGCVYLRRRRA